jgi:eukaryotic-like serine/threonine-protein kinase
LPERYLGQTLGKYRIDAVIGSGGFAWVYKAFDPELEIPVALKILKPQYAGDESFEQRFRREASTAAKLRHPNIINIFAVGKENGAVYFAMDYLPQGLADRLSVMTTLPESMLIRMAIDVSSALGFAHREGVIHRDIKTDNILFDEHGNAVVADFGIARAVAGYAEQTGTNMVMGTPQYFAPEQARGLALDGRADIYSLGVTLFKAATGSLPFTGEDWYEIARQHVEEKPPRPRSLNASISRELEDVILRCLEKDPENRYPSGEAMCEDLAEILQERGESAAMRTVTVPTAATLPPGTPLPKIRRRRRGTSPMTWFFVAIAAVVVLGVGLSFTIGGGSSSTANGATPTPTGTNPSPLNIPVGSSPTPEPKRSVTIRVPDGARVRIGSDTVSTGSFTTDTLSPGKYTVVASVPTRTGCPFATAQKTIEVRPAGVDTFPLFPSDCGTVVIEAKYNGKAGQGRYSLSTLGWKEEKDLPKKGRVSVTVPAGQIQIRVSAQYCTAYNFSFRVAAGASIRQTPTLLCGIEG